MGSIIRTIDELLGLGSLNLEDALAGEVADVFDNHRQLTPYAVRPVDPRIFIPSKARFAKPKSAKEAAALRDMDDAEEIRTEMQRSAGTLRRPQD
jgi:hypothetical protein